MFGRTTIISDEPQNVYNSHRQTQQTSTNRFTCVCSLGMFGRATIISDALMNPQIPILGQGTIAADPAQTRYKP
jgi:hypothetical protein